MKTAMTIALSILICAGAFAQKQSERLQPSCGERKTKFDVHTAGTGILPKLEPGNSEIYVAEVAERAFLLDPRKITIRIGVDGEWVGAVKGTSTYMAVLVGPGEHQVCAERQSLQASMETEAGVINFTAEPNKRYYFRAQFREHSGIKLEQVGGEEGELLISSSHLVISTPRK